MKLIVQNYYKIILFLIFVSALFLRWIYLPSGAISFAYDQARDAFIVQSLLSGDLKLLGPSVSGVPGLFHGVLYYYVIAPAYLIGQGNPVVVAFWLSFLSSLVVYVVYKLAYLLTKDKTPALISALIFAFSFETSQYANLLTNASMGVWFVPILYTGLYIWITEHNSKNKNVFIKFAPALTGLSLGLSIQSELALAYHMFPLLAWLFVYRKKITKKQIAFFGFAFFISIFTMVIAEVKFGFTGLSGVIYLLLGGDGIVQSKNLSDYLITILDQSGKTFAYTIFPINKVLGGVLGFLMIIVSVALNLNRIKKKFLSWETFLIS